MPDSFVTFDDCTAIRTTAKAILVRFPDREEALWIPQSQIHDDSDVWRKGDHGKLVISEWLANEKDLL